MNYSPGPLKGLYRGLSQRSLRGDTGSFKRRRDTDDPVRVAVTGGW